MARNATAYSGEKLAELLEHRGLRFGWFAERLGERVRGKAYAPSYVSKLMSGDKPITDEIAVAVADILGVPAHWLHADAEVREEVPA